MRILLLVYLWLAIVPAFANNNEKAASDLAKRIVPRFAGKIRFEQLPGKETKDRFELESAGDHLVIRGNSANSMAMGLNHYLKYYCKSSVSWYFCDPIELPDVLPVIENKVKIAARTVST